MKAQSDQDKERGGKGGGLPVQRQWRGFGQFCVGASHQLLHCARACDRNGHRPDGGSGANSLTDSRARAHIEAN